MMRGKVGRVVVKMVAMRGSEEITLKMGEREGAMGIAWVEPGRVNAERWIVERDGTVYGCVSRGKIESRCGSGERWRGSGWWACEVVIDGTPSASRR